VVAQVLAGEGEVACLLRDVDPHDALDERVELAAAAQDRPLDVIDRVLTAEHEDEEHGREPAGHLHHRPGAEPEVPGEPRGIEATAVDELLEHQRVLRLLDDLVVHVPELG
jgi:hypothetical protein